MAESIPPTPQRLLRLPLRVFATLLVVLVPTLSFAFARSPELPQGDAQLSQIGTHLYELRLAPDEFARVVVRQLGTDIVLEVQNLELTIDSASGSAGQEEVMLIGSARLKITPGDRQLRARAYQISIEERRRATPLDRKRLSIQRTFFEGERLRRHTKNRDLLEMAVTRLNQAIEGWREDNDRRWQALALRSRGATYFYLNMMSESLASYEAALTILRLLPDRLDEASALNSMAITQLDQGDSANAIKSFERSLELFKSVPDEKFVGRTLYQLGRAAYLLGDLEGALRFYEEALPLRQRYDTDGEAFVLLGIGRVYANGFVDHQKALDYYRRALKYLTPGSSPRLAQLLGDIGRIHFARREYDTALIEYQKALNEKPDALITAEILMYVGMVYAAKEQHEKALQHFNSALGLQCKSIEENGVAVTLGNFRRESCDLIGAAHTLKNIGLSYSAMKNYDGALSRLNQALQIWSHVLYRTAEADTRYEIAGVLKRQEKFAEARQQLETALPIVEALRSKMTNQHFRISYFASAQKFYELSIDLLMRQYAQTQDRSLLATALTYSERARTRSMLDTLIEAQANIRSDASTEDQKTETALQRKLSLLSQRQLIDPRQKESDKVRIRAELDALVADYHALDARIRVSSPRYAGLTRPEPVSVEAIQQLLDPDQMLLEFALGDERSYLWAVTRQSIRGYELPKREELERDSDRLRTLLNEQNPEYQKVASALYETLLKPVALSDDTPRLLIVPAGRLQYLPFSALPVPIRGTQSAFEAIVAGKSASVPLLVYHEIETLPSVSVLAQLRKERREREPVKRKEVLVVADPVFELEDDRFRKLPRVGTLQANRKDAAGQNRTPGGGPGRLIFTDREATAILSALPSGMSGDKVLGFDANQDFVTRSGALSNYRIVHFATHGLIDDEHPLLSGIMLSLFDDRRHERDGLLQTHEIYNLNIDAEMVVLSACDTSIGREMKGEGLPGLSRAFIYAGARRIVATLWQVRDDSTTAVMTAFYRKLFQQNGVRPAAALREAQLELWKKAPSRSPHRWAAFVTYGDATFPGGRGN